MLTAEQDTQELTVTVDADMYARLESLSGRLGLSVEDYTASCIAAAIRLTQLSQGTGYAQGVSADHPSRLG